MPDENQAQDWLNQTSATEPKQVDDYDLSFWDWDFSNSETSETTNKTDWENNNVAENGDSVGESNTNNDTKADSSDNFNISMWDSTNNNTNENHVNNISIDNKSITPQSSNLPGNNTNTTSVDVNWSSDIELDLEIPKDHAWQKYVINIHFK